jgi:tRNA-dihydrouridine synthase A
MMEWTDRHDRYFLRLISRRVHLYTEMVTTGALLHGDRQRLLAFDPKEHPLALQLGGNEPAEMASCARLAQEHGFDEVNMNVGCPSDRVQSAVFGACLMAEPERVAACVAAMGEVVDIPVTVKTRIGIDRKESTGFLENFVGQVAAAGCDTFIIHARKAWLDGLSPKENREIPPLRYEVVYQLKRAFPQLEIIINGGITTLTEGEEHLRQVDGFMLGRAAYHNPYILADVDRCFFGQMGGKAPTRHEVLEQFIPYVEQQLALGVPLGRMTRHILGLFQGMPGARAFRRYISEHAHQPGADALVIRAATEKVALTGSAPG